MARIYEKQWGDQGEYSDVIPGFSVKHAGPFNASYLWYYLREWLIENDWVSSKEADFGETYYEHKETSGGDEIVARWRFKKSSTTTKPGDPNYEMYMVMKIHIMFMKNIEVMVDGKRVKTNSGEVEIAVDGRYSFEGKGWDNPIMKYLQPMIWNRYWLERKDDVEGAGIGEFNDFQAAILSYFKHPAGGDFEMENFFLKKDEGK